MLESFRSLWQKQTEENKSLAKKVAIASIGLYALLQLVSFILPIAIAIAIGIGFWCYKSFFDKNPRILR